MPSVQTLAVAALGVMVIVLLALAVRHAPAPHGRSDSVSAGGFTLKSATIELPTDDPLFPDAPHADLVNAHCTGCHSASMALTQPPLDADKWQAEVKKMREVYKAPVPDSAVPGIVAYLTAMSAGQKGR